MCAVAVALLFCMTTGCGSKQSNFKVSGTIKYDGQPVPEGEVHLRPSQGNYGSGGFAIIKDGKYETIPKRGVEGGFYKLTFHGLGGDAIDEFGGGGDLFTPYVVEVDFPKEDHVLNVDVPKQ